MLMLIVAVSGKGGNVENAGTAWRNVVVVYISPHPHLTTLVSSRLPSTSKLTPG